jgi:HPt (histidine-containing phosphotransfer) domain-containing protein
MSLSPEEEQELRGLSAAYAAGLSEKMRQIEELRARIASHQMEADLQTLCGRLHALAGSGAIFGYSMLSSTAKELELALTPHLGDALAAAAALEQLQPQFQRLHEAAAAPDCPDQL